MTSFFKIIGVCFGALLFVALIFGLLFGWFALLTLAAQYVALALFAKTLPFWPTLVCIWLLGVIFGGRRASEAVQGLRKS